MTEIQKLELDFWNAEVHLENAKTFVEIHGVNYDTLAIYFDALEKRNAIKQKLEEAQKQWKTAGLALLFSCSKKGKIVEKYGKMW